MKRRITALLIAFVLIMMTPMLLIGVDAVNLNTEPKEEYNIGDDVWVQGQGKEPQYRTVPGGKWSPVIKNGVHHSETVACPIPDHPSHQLSSCYGPAPLECGEEHEHSSDCYGDPPLICGLEIHKDGSLQCVLNRKKYYDYYHWQVISDGSATLPTVEDTEDTDDPENSTTGTTLPPVEDNPCVLYIDCMDPVGKRLQGAEFFLLEYKPDADPDEEIAVIVHGTAEETAGKGIVATLDFSGYIQDHNITEDVVWRLGQQAFSGDLAEQYCEISEAYYVIAGPDENDNMVLKGVSLTPPELPESGSAGTEGEGAAEIQFVNADNYSSTTRTLTVVNQPWRGTIQIDLITLGFENAAPEGFEATVTLTYPDQSVKEMEADNPGFYLSKEVLDGYAAYAGQFDTGIRLVQDRYENVSMGKYVVTVTEPVEIEGYKTKAPVVQLRYPVDASPESTNEVTLSKGRSALFTVIYEYIPEVTQTEPPTTEPPTTEPPTTEPPTTEPPTTEPPTTEPPTTEPPTTEPPTTEPPTTEPPTTEPPTTEPPTTEPPTTVPPTTMPPATDAPAGSGNDSNSGNDEDETSNTVVIKIVDDLGRDLENCEIGLYKDGDLVKKWKATYGNTFILDKLGNLVGAGESESFILKQTKAAAGYRLSTDTFKVKITNSAGSSRVEVNKDNGVLGNLLTGTGVEIGTDGKQIVTFVNERKTAEIELSCDVVADFGEGTWKDDSLIKEFQERKYEFILTWENAEGEPEEERIVLTAGEKEVLKADLPFGTDYSLRVAETEGDYRTEFSDNFEGTVGTAELAGPIQIEAIHTFSIESGTPAVLSLVKVDAATKTPLTGVQFRLEDGYGNEIRSYISGEQGQIELTDVLTAPGNYKLVETEPLEGYEVLRPDIAVNVAVQYSKEEKNGAPVLVQTMIAQLSGDMIVAESDGSYWVENTQIGTTENQQKEKNGISTTTIIGLCAAGVAVMAGTAIVLIIRKRKMM